MASPSFGDREKNVIDLLYCPICEELMYPPIWQCTEGHVLCSNCKSHVNNNCPTCRGEIGSIRCRALENMAQEASFPCNNIDLGCSLILKYDSKREHEKTCRHRPYRCPFNIFEDSLCYVNGDIDKLVTHLKVDHKASEINGNAIDISVDLSLSSPPVLDVIVCSYESYRFCLFVTKSTSSELVRINLSFMGEEEDARYFRGELKVGYEGISMNQWSGFPRGIRVAGPYDGLVFCPDLRSSVGIPRSTVRIEGFIWSAEVRISLDRFGDPILETEGSDMLNSKKLLATLPGEFLKRREQLLQIEEIQNMRSRRNTLYATLNKKKQDFLAAKEIYLQQMEKKLTTFPIFENFKISYLQDTRKLVARKRKKNDG